MSISQLVITTTMQIPFSNKIKPFRICNCRSNQAYNIIQIENLKQSFILCFEKNKLKYFKNLSILPKGMTHAMPIPMVITALYRNDVQFGDKRIPFKMVNA